MNKDIDFIELDINNYELDDLLNLFNIPLDFNEEDLKRAKAITLKTHPDKSRLDKKYFMFYSKAYKMIYSLWEFRKKGDINQEKNKNTEYIEPIIMAETMKDTLSGFLKEKKMEPKEFNSWFNEQFEKNKIQSESDSKGYESWLRDPNNMDQDLKGRNVTMANMGSEFERKKERVQALSIYKGVEDVFSGSTSNVSMLSTDAPETYDSGLFSSLAYQDLQKAHEETVIPVTYKDYEKREKFTNVNEYISHRGLQDTKPLSERHAMEYLANRNKNDEESSVRRAYDLAKQTEMAKKKQQEFWSSIHLLK